MTRIERETGSYDYYKNEKSTKTASKQEQKTKTVAKQALANERESKSRSIKGTWEKGTISSRMSQATRSSFIGTKQEQPASVLPNKKTESMNLGKWKDPKEDNAKLKAVDKHPGLEQAFTELQKNQPESSPPPPMSQLKVGKWEETHFEKTILDPKSEAELRDAISEMSVDSFLDEMLEEMDLQELLDEFKKGQEEQK